jgi:hypothetical protein
MNSKYIIDPNGRYDSVVGSVIRYGIGLPLICVLLWVALSCVGCASTKPVIAKETHTENSKHNTTDRDQRNYSIYVHDSIFIYIKGDTVTKHIYHTEYRDRWRDRYIHITDTLHTVDSIPQIVEVEKPVPYKSGYTKFTSWFFWIVVIVFLLWAAWKICDKIPATKPYTAMIRGILKIGKFF